MKEIQKRLRAIVYVKDEPVRLVFQGDLTDDEKDQVLDHIHGREETPLKLTRTEVFKDFGSSYSIINLTSENPTELNAKVDTMFRGTKRIVLNDAKKFTDVVKNIGTVIASIN